MTRAGSSFLVPYLRSSAEAVGAVLVAGEGGPTNVTLTVRRPNGQVAREVSFVSAGDGSTPQVALADLYAIADCGVIQVEAEGAVVIHVETEAGGERHRDAFSPADSDPGTAFELGETDPAHPFAMLANTGRDELFVFVNDMQGPFIPPFGSARIQVPKPGGRLHITVDNGEGILTYKGRLIPPTA